MVDVDFSPRTPDDGRGFPPTDSLECPASEDNVLPLTEYRERQQRLRAAMAERGIDAIYLSFTPTLAYIAGLPTRRRGATETRHPGDWLTGAFYTQNDELIVMAPRMDQRWVVPAVEAVPWIQELRI